MIENAELIMQMLEMYQMYKQQVPAELDEYLRYVAETGNTLFQWTLVKPFLREKILNVIAEFAEQSALADIPPYPNVDPFNYEAMKTMLLERFDTFNGPPFTIQRLCELLTCPRKEYNRVDKFMRAVEKNILVVSTCELRSKREEAIVVNGVPDRWENGKESDVNMDLVDKSNVVSEASVLNGNESVESLLNELEAMKTPETKLDEVKPELKEHLVTQVTDEVIKSDPITEEPQPGTQSLITDTLQTQVTDTTEVVEQVKTDVETTLSESIVDSSQEKTSVVCDEIQPVVHEEKITENPIEDHIELSNDINIENVEPETKEPIVESNKQDLPDLIPPDTVRMEGSVIHLTPDSDDKKEPDVAASQLVIQLEKSSDDINSMEVQVEDVNKISDESEVNCDNNIEKSCTETTTTIVEVDKQDIESTVEIPVAMDTIPLKMDVEPEIEPEKIENSVTQKEAVNEQETKTSEPNTENQEQSENKLTESE